MLEWLEKFLCPQENSRREQRSYRKEKLVEVSNPPQTEVEEEFLRVLETNRVELMPDPRPIKYLEHYFVLGEYEFRLGSDNDWYFYKQEKYLGKVRPEYHSKLGAKFYYQNKKDVEKSLQEDFVK